MKTKAQKEAHEDHKDKMQQDRSVQEQGKITPLSSVTGFTMNNKAFKWNI